MIERLDLFLSAVRSALQDTKFSDPVADEELWAMYKPAAFFHLENCLYHAMKDSGRQTSEEQDMAFMLGIRLDAEQAYAFAELKREFSHVGIGIMPMKGTILKQIYRSSEMRYMGDLDILYRGDEAALLAVMSSLGYTAKPFKAHSTHRIFVRGQVKVEMYHRLMQEGALLYDALEDVWDRAKPRRMAPNVYDMAPSDLYLHLLSLAAMHLASGGTGLRTFYDHAVLTERYPEVESDERVTAALKAEGLTQFASAVNRIADLLYYGGDFEGDEEMVIRGLMQSGIFGTRKGYAARTMAKQTKRGMPSRLKYMMMRIFPSVSHLAERYPFLRSGGARVLLYPFFWLRRFITVLFHSRYHIFRDLMMFGKVDEADVVSARFEQSFFGLAELSIPRRER